MKIFKKILIGVAIFLGLILLVLAGGRIYLGSDHAQRLIQGRISGAIPGEVSWGDFGLSSFDGQIELKDIAIKGPGGARLISLDRLFLDWSWRALLRLELNAETVIMEKPRVLLSMDREGGLDLIRAFSEGKPGEETPEAPASEKGAPFNVTLGELRLLHGFFQFTSEGGADGEGAGRVELHDIALTARDGDLLKKALGFTLGIDRTKLDMAGVHTRLDRFQLKGSFAGDRVDGLTLGLNAHDSSLALSGGASDLFSNPRCDLELALGVSLSDVKEIFRVEPGLSGRANLRVVVNGPVNDPGASLALEFAGGDILGSRVERIDMTCALKERVVTINGLNVVAPRGKLGLTGEVDLRKTFAEGFLSSRPDLDAVSYTLRLDQKETLLETLPGIDAGIRGEVNSTLSIEGEGVSPESLSSRAALEFSLKGLALEGTLSPVDVAVSARAGLERGRVEVERFEARTGEIRVRADGVYNIASREITGGLGLELPDLARDLAPLGETDARGKLAVNARVSGSVERPEAALETRGEALGRGEFEIGSARLNARLAPSGIVEISEFAVENQGSFARVKGAIQVFDQEMKVNPGLPAEISLTFEEIEAKDFMEKAPVTGKVHGSLDLNGSLMAPRASLVLGGRGLQFRETRVGDLDAALKFAEGGLTVDRLNLRNGESTLDLSGVVQVTERDSLTPLEDPVFDLTLDNGALFPADFVDSFKGKALLTGRIRGSLSDPEAEVSVKGAGLAADKQRLGDLDADVRFSRGTLHLDPVRLRNGASRLELTGEAHVLDVKTFKPLEEPRLSLELAAAPLLLEDFIPEMKGELTLKGQIKGSPSDPVGSVELLGENIDVGVQKIAGVRLKSKIANRRIDIDAFHVTLAPKEEIQAGGWISLDKTYDIHLESGGVSLKHIDALRGQDLGDAKIILDLAGKGDLENPEIRGEVGVKDLRIKNRKIEDIQLRVSVKDHLARVSVERKFDLDARIDLRTKNASAFVEFDRTDLTPFFKIAGHEDVNGVVTGKITVEGNVDAPGRLRADVDLSELSLFMKETMLARTRDLKASFKNGRVTVPGVHIELLEHGSLDVKGEGRLDGPLNFNAEGHVPAKTVRLFTEELPDIAGRINFTASVTGALPQPDVRADVTLEKIEMTVPTLFQKVSDLDARVRITPDAVTLENMQGMLDEGRFELSGKIDLEKFQPSKILVNVKARAFPVEVPDTMEILFDADLTISGVPEKASIRGDTTLIEGRYYKDVKLQLLKTIRTKKRRAPARASGTDLPFLKNMSMDVKLKYKDPFVVDNNLALMTLKPDLHIHGTVNTPLVSGRAEADSGMITYQKKVFEIRKGVLDFINPYKIEPTIDVVSDVEIREWTITLAVSGVPDNLEFTLTSSPSESSADIVSLLLFGKTNREREESSGSLSPTQMIADVVADGLTTNIKDATGLDILEVEYNEAEDKDERDEIKVTVGEELSRRVTLKYGMDAKKGQLVQRVTAEYKLLENLLLRVHEDTADNFGGEIQYRLDFR
ncbi:MAG: hypothetical protein GY859_24850 [Desulfobacterales bacterium]|nr:hypothetical protein [Desulfobacterales bacterium]